MENENTINSEDEEEVIEWIVNKLKSLFSKERKFKTEDGKKFYSSDFLYVPDENKPSTWKLRIAEGESGNVTVAQLGRAAAAFSSGGFRGNRVELPSGESGSIKRKLRGLYKKLGVNDDDIPDSIKKESSFMIWKDINGRYRWIARYSNNYRDSDMPVREIISKESHLRFVNMVDEGKADYPELWHWHIKGSKWGQSDWLAYDEENGIALAAGYVLDGHEKEAEALAESELEIGVSHGMPPLSVARDMLDKSIIVEHITREISDLPLLAAANKLTSFSIIKENEMGIPAKKKEYLKTLGMTDEDISEIENGNAEMAKQAGDLNLDSKESETTETEEKHEEESTQVEQEVKEEDAAPEKKEEVKEHVMYITADQFNDAIKQVIDSVGDALKSIRDEISSINTELTSVKEVKSAFAETPSASIAAMIAQSAIGRKETQVKKSEMLAKSSPVETPDQDSSKAIVTSGNPVIDSILTNIIGR